MAEPEGAPEINRVAYGDEVDKSQGDLDLFIAPDVDGDCTDCGTSPGEYHRCGCDQEQCAKCGRQFISCNHLYGGREMTAEEMNMTASDIIKQLSEK